MTLKEIKDLIQVFDGSGLSRLELENEGFSVSMEKGGSHVMTHQPIIHSAPQMQASPTAPIEPRQDTPKSSAVTKGETIKAPMIGTFYRSPSPSTPAYVKVGDTVKKGHPLAIIEAMKIMNEIDAEFDCKILEIVPEDGQPIEYDAPLFIVERV